MKKSQLSLFIATTLLLTSCSQMPASNDVASSGKVIIQTISQIQGAGMHSPVAGIDMAKKQYLSQDNYQVQGVITAIVREPLGRDLSQGFFLQGESDNNPATSDGIFVETDQLDGIAVGNLVTLTARVKEDYQWTKLVNVRQLKVLQNQVALPKPVVLNVAGQDFFQALESVEGMRVRIEKVSDMHVAKNYGFDYDAKRNNLALAHQDVLYHPNQFQAPRRGKAPVDPLLVVESFQKAPNGQVLYYPTFGAPNGKKSSDNYIRLNDQVDGLEGVVGYSFGQYRLYVTNEATGKTFIHMDDRKSAPVLKKGGDLRVASFNVLNYFNPPYDTRRNPLGQNRGATTEEAFALQSAKIAQAIVNMDADIVGLMEIENNGFDHQSAVADLVKQINARIKNPALHYAYVKPQDGTKFIGTDAITNQVLYRPAKVSLADYRIIKMPSQHAPKVDYLDQAKRSKYHNGNSYQRDTVAPTFKINGTDKTLTVAVNHFKSKGSVCWEDVRSGKLDDSDIQGSCENFRVSASLRLGEALSEIKGNKIILGDLNSYANEDPIMVLTNRDNAPKDYQIKTASFTYLGDKALQGRDPKVVDKSFGYVNIIRKLHPKAYSYAYKNHVGSLDYILISPSLEKAVVDANDWSINANESTLFEYADKYNCTPAKQCSARYTDIYRASDHNPAVIDLNVSQL